MLSAVFSCAKAARLASMAQDAPLRPLQSLALKANLMMCGGCVNFARQMSFMRRAARKLPEALERDDAAQ